MADEGIGGAALLQRIEELVAEAVELRRTTREAVEAKAQAEKERDAAMQREDEVMARGMQIGIYSDHVMRAEKITFAFDSDMLRLSRNWRDVFVAGIQKMMTQVDEHLRK